MDVANVNAFIEVVVSTFETSCNAKPSRRADFERVDGELANEYELMSVVEFTGGLQGSVAFCFPAETAKKVYGAMMMEEVEEFNEEVAEGFAEIVNMVAGNTKASLANKKLEFQPTRNIVGIGETYANPGGHPWLKVPMAFKKMGVFDLYVGMEEA